MGLDFVGNPNKIEYESIDDIDADEYINEENAEVFGNSIEMYESSEYDDADDFDYDPYDALFSDDPDMSNGSEFSEEPLSTNDSESDEEIELPQQQKSNSTITNSLKTPDAARETPGDPSVNEADTNT